MKSEAIVEQVREKYGALAKSGLAPGGEGARLVAEAFGYTAEELASLPEGANLGLSCGNPTATAHLKPGEVVVDLGSGGGLDVFLASKKVGPTGKAIGIDMTGEMIERARTAASRFGGGTAPSNVEFHQARIDQLPLADNSVDVIISNCVINLAPDKRAVFREMFRVLKPGGRVAVSDIATKKELPEELGQDLLAYVGCIAGAISFKDYEQGLAEAGFQAVQLVDTRKDLNAYASVENQSGCCSPAMNTAPATASSCCTPAPAGSSECCAPNEGAEPTAAGCCGPVASEASTCCSPATNDVHAGLAELLRKYDVNEYAASVQVYALKGR